MTFPDTLRPLQRRRHLADRRKAQERVARERRQAARRCAKEYAMMGDGLLPVAQMLWPTDERSEDETQANARLIAAAPELLEALELIAANPNNLRHRQPFLGIVQTAIAKAAGAA